MLNKFNVLAGGLTPPDGLVKNNDYTWVAILLTIVFCLVMVFGLIKSISVKKDKETEENNDSFDKSDE